MNRDLEQPQVICFCLKSVRNKNSIDVHKMAYTGKYHLIIVNLEIGYLFTSCIGDFIRNFLVENQFWL